MVEFFASHRVIFLIFSLLTFPFVLAGSLIYGMIIGIIGITVDRYEYVRDIIYQDAINVLKYPQWMAKKHQEAYLGTLDTPSERQEAEMAFASGRKKAPGMVDYFIQDILIFGFLTYPFLLLRGIVTGPIRAFIEYTKWWYKVGEQSTKGG